MRESEIDQAELEQKRQNRLAPGPWHTFGYKILYKRNFYDDFCLAFQYIVTQWAGMTYSDRITIGIIKGKNTELFAVRRN